mgnify:CR=1 FL=1
MDITTALEGTKATIGLVGKLAVQTSPDLEATIAALPATTTDFAIDLTDLDYISSAGLRVLVSTQKLAERRGGTLRILHPIDDVFDVFEMTGLSEIFDIER